MTQDEPTPAHPVGLDELVTRRWLDHLVDLQVLAAHGDLEAAVTAAHWLAHDPEARAVWLSVAADCRMTRPNRIDA